MPIVTTIAGLSQTAASNGPDGAVDPPSSLDDQDRYHGSFIAMLRDGVGFTPGALTSPTGALGFTPVRQGTGAGQGANTVSIGWSSGLQKLLVSVDTNAFANRWPIDIDGQSKSVLGVNGTPFTFSWTDPGGGAGQYVLAADTAGVMFVRPQSALNVALATNANNAYGCSGNAATASNASAVNGISGWNYSNRNYNPPYLWATAGSGSDQFLVQPGNLSVSYASTAGSAPANGGTAQNSNQLNGVDSNYFVNRGGSAVVNLRNNATIQMLCGVTGIGDMYWGASVSDERLKKDIAPTIVDSLGQIARMRFVRFRFREDLDFQVDPIAGREWPVGVLAQEAELIEPNWISSAGTWMQPDQYAMLMSAMHAIQQLSEQVRELKKLVNV